MPHSRISRAYGPKSTRIALQVFKSGQGADLVAQAGRDALLLEAAHLLHEVGARELDAEQLDHRPDLPCPVVVAGAQIVLVDVLQVADEAAQAELRPDAAELALVDQGRLDHVLRL